MNMAQSIPKLQRCTVGPRLSEPQHVRTQRRIVFKPTPQLHRTRCGSESRGPGELLASLNFEQL